MLIHVGAGYQLTSAGKIISGGPVLEVVQPPGPCFEQDTGVLDQLAMQHLIVKADIEVHDPILVKAQS